MTEVAFVFISDSHLDEYTFTDLDQMRNDTYYGFQQAVDIACSLKRDMVAAGDNWECNKQDHPTAVTVGFFVRQMERLRELGLKFYYVNGQHDRSHNGASWPQAVHPTVAIPIHMKRVVIRGIPVVGLDAMFSHELQPAMEAAATLLRPDDNPVFVCHQRWKELLKFEGAEDGRLADIPDRFRTVITGDMHVHKVLRSRKKVDGLDPRIIISPGTQARRSSSEPDDHYAWLMNTDRTYEPIKLKERQVLRIKVTNVHDVDDAADKCDTRIKQFTEASIGLPVELSKPLLLVKGSPTRELFSAVQRIYGEHFHVKLSGTAGREAISDVAHFAQHTPSVGELSVRQFVNELSQNPQVDELVTNLLSVSKGKMHDVVAAWRREQV